MSTPHPGTDRPTRTSPLEALRTRWWLAVALPLVLAVVGYVIGLSRPPTYTAEARVAVGKGSLTSGAIAGFPEAASTLAANYARYVNSTGVTSSTMGTKGVTLSASPVPDSYVIQVLGEGADQDAVVAATQKAADQLVRTVNSGNGTNDADKTLAEYKRLSARYGRAKANLDAATSNVGKLQGRRGETAAREAMAAAQAEASNLQVQMDALGQKYTNQVANASTDADLTLVRRAEVTASTKSATAQQFLLGGLVAGALLALALAWLLESRARSLPDRTPTRADAPNDTASVPTR